MSRVQEKILVDTDVVLDLLLQRSPFYMAAASMFSLAESGGIKIYITPVLISNLYYILRKTFGKDTAGRMIRNLRLIVSIARVDETSVDRVLSSEFSDFEDGLQYFAAVQYGCEALITRNIKDYGSAKIAVMTADEWLSSKGAK